jgi:hypothetical protein
MRCVAVLATPTPVLHFQRICKAFFLDLLHVLQYTLSVRILCIRNKRLHEFAGYQFVALMAEFISFALGTSLDAAGGTIPGGLLTFASVALLVHIYSSGLCRQHDRASAAISMQYKVHI